MTPTGHGHGRRDEGGFALVEIIVATTILMIILVALSSLLTDSLTVALISRQQEAAAALAADAIQNARAIGEAGLVISPSPLLACTQSQLPTGLQTPTTPPSSLAFTAANFGQCSYTTTVDSNATIFRVSSVTTASGTLDSVTVTVTWPAGTPAHTYATTSQVGT